MDLKNLPDVYGEGIIFAFSGFDGKTDTQSGFVGTFSREKCGLLIHTSPRRFLKISGIPADAETEIASGDMLSIKGLLKMSFCAWHTIIGSADLSLSFSLLEKDGNSSKNEGSSFFSESDSGVLVLLVGNGRFALSFAASIKEAAARAESGLKADISSEFSKRLAFFGTAPQLNASAHERLFRKCLTVLKVNTLSPEASMTDFWSTPDRVPHRKMWLWDSVFHSFLMNKVDSSLSWQFLKSVIDMQREDGMVPHMMDWNGGRSEITQPPVLSWGVWDNYKASGNIETLHYAFPRLEKYLDWNMKNRDFNNNSLLEWFIEGDERCRSGESGLDNSTRFDEALLMDAVDFSVFQSLDYGFLAQIADAVGEKEKAASFRNLSDKIANAVQSLLWSESDQFYLDRKTDGSFCKVRAVSGFLPLLLNNTPSERVKALLSALEDKSDFNSEFPVPSVSLGTPDFSTDMWRGSTWLNFNWFISEGLKKHGHADSAASIREKTVRYVDKYYRLNGTIFEFYDATDKLAPWDCHRKGARKGRFYLDEKVDSIRDYNWSACFTALMILEDK